MMLKMTIDECQEAIKGIFRELYPNCTVTYSYPGIFERPPLPYVLLDFGKVDSTRVDSSFSQNDGLLYQTWHNSMALTVDMVENCKTTHTNGKVTAPKFRAVADLAQAVAYINSPMLEDRMLGLDIAISTESSPQPIYGSGPGVDRAQCAFSIDFTTTTKEYAALQALDKEYEELRPASASKKLADFEAGFFIGVEVKADTLKEKTDEY